MLSVAESAPRPGPRLALARHRKTRLRRNRVRRRITRPAGAGSPVDYRANDGVPRFRARDPTHRTILMRLILTLTCPDRPGIVHAVSGFLLAQSGNILEAAQYDDAVTGVFYMRVCFEMGKSDARSPAQMDELFAPLASEFGMKSREPRTSSMLLSESVPP